MTDWTAVDAATAFDDDPDGVKWGAFDYSPIIDSIGTVALQVDDDDYQGDSRVLFKEPWGVLIFGWGSCSGCDALQGANSWAEVAALRNDIAKDVVWADTPEELLRYVNEHDWEGDFSWHAEETHRFLSEAKTILGVAS